jgi:hypothetical protein
LEARNPKNSNPRKNRKKKTVAGRLRKKNSMSRMALRRVRRSRRRRTMGGKH